MSVILFHKKKMCCGCLACAAVCPQKAISVKKDGEGFRYPELHLKRCVGCGLCQTVCPWQGKEFPETNPQYFAAQARAEELRKNSTSGAVFPLLAEYFLQNGGVAYGAGFDSAMQLVHKRAERLEEIAPLTQSKYIQSSLEGIFHTVEQDLKNHRRVLFTGTPCQTEAVRKFLRQEYTNLLLVDLICYGVPSPAVWKSYVAALEKKYGGKLEAFHFRDKRNRDDGHTMSYQIGGKEYVEDYFENPYKNMYASGCSLRPSCHDCRFCTTQRNSDITIGDFWGIEKKVPEMNDGMGTSLVLLHSEKGARIWNAIRGQLRYIECEKDEILQPRLISPTQPSKHRILFFRLYRSIPFSVLALLFRSQKLRRFWYGEKG